MSFLQPLAGVLLGGIASAVLLLFYFLKLRRRPIRVGSTMLWQRAVHDLEVNQPFQWIRTNRLLFLQLLALLLLAIAFARPVVESGGENAARLVILIDRSASMAVADGEGGATRLDVAKERAVELARAGVASGQTDVLIATYASGMDDLTGWTRSRSRLERAARGIEQTDQPDALVQALERLRPVVIDQVGSEEDAADSVRVVILTDRADAIAAGIAGRVEVERVGGVLTAENVGIVAIGARRDYDEPSMVRLFGRLAGTSGATGVVSVELLLDGTPVDRRTVELTDEGGLSASVSFEREVPDAALLTLRIGRADALASDNSASVVVPALQRPVTAMVTPGNPDSDPVAWLTRDVLEALDPEELIVVSEAAFASDPESVLRGAAWVVFDRVTPEALPSVPSLSLGASLPVAGLSAAGDTGPTRVVTWRREHPTLAYAGLGRILIEETIGLRVSESDDGEGAGARAVVRELAAGRGGPLIVEIEDAGLRRLVVGFEPAESSWPLDEGYAIFLATSLERLSYSGESGLGRFAVVGDGAVVSRRGGAASVRLEGPDGLVLEGRDGGAGGEIEVGVPVRAGVYRDGIGGSVLAVNLVDERETLVKISAVDPGNESEDSGDGSGSGSTGVGSASGSGPREVWWWFVLGALTVVGIEWAVYLGRARLAAIGDQR